MERWKFVSFQSTFHSGRTPYESHFVLKQHFPSNHSGNFALLITAFHMGSASKDPGYSLPGAPEPETGLGRCNLEKMDIHASLHPEMPQLQSHKACPQKAISCLIHKPSSELLECKSSSYTQQPETQSELILKGSTRKIV
jgi:hypothetical protein